MRKNKKISSGIVKTLADGKTLNFEVLFGTEMTIDMLAKPILICNPPLVFDSDMDGGYGGRNHQATAGVADLGAQLR